MRRRPAEPSSPDTAGACPDKIGRSAGLIAARWQRLTLDEMERCAGTEAAMHAQVEQMDRLMHGLRGDGHRGAPEQ
jgi:hypothetical protein